MARVTQSRNWTSVASNQQKDPRLLYFGRRCLRLCTGGRELIGHPDQLGQGRGTHLSHHLAAIDLHRRPAQPNCAAICLLRRPALTSVITSHTCAASTCRTCSQFRKSFPV